MQEFEKEQHREERKRPRREVRAEKSSGFPRRLGGGNRRRRRLVVVFLLVTLAALIFLTYSLPGNELLTRLTGAGAQPVEEKQQAAAPETPTVEEEQPAEEEQEEAASGQPAEAEPVNIYAATMSEDDTKASLADLPERVYVPNTIDGTVDVIDPETFQVVDSFAVGEIPYHITPSWDMSGLYVNNEQSSTFTVIDPETGRPSGTVSASFPYNFYYTPDGEKAIIVVERLQTLEFRDTETWELMGSVYVPWSGVDHLDFSADGGYLLAGTEYGGVLAKIDSETMEIVDFVEVGGLPIDVRLSPDGEVFYVANQGAAAGVHVIDPETMEEVGFIPTGEGAHGLQIGRDTSLMYVANRDAGTVSVVNLSTNEIVDTWVTGGSPDMFQLSPDGKQL